jgi:hypothetical protein
MFLRRSAVEKFDYEINRFWNEHRLWLKKVGSNDRRSLGSTRGLTEFIAASPQNFRPHIVCGRRSSIMTHSAH